MTADNRPAPIETYDAERINLPESAAYFAKKRCPCSSHPLCIARVSSSSAIPGCNPSKIASTMSGANSVSRWQPVDEAPSYAIHFCDLRRRPIPPLLQHSPPPMRPRQRTDQRLVWPWFRGAQASPPSGAI